MIDAIPAGNMQLHRNTMRLAISKLIDPKFPINFKAQIVTIFKPNFIDYLSIYFTVDYTCDLFSTLILAIRIITMSLVTAHSFKLVGEDAVDRCASCLCHVNMAINDMIRVNIFARNGWCDVGVIVAGTISMQGFLITKRLSSCCGI